MLAKAIRLALFILLAPVISSGHIGGEQFSSGLIIQGPLHLKEKLSEQLRAITKTEIGAGVIRRIIQSKKLVTIGDDPRARAASGLTGYKSSPQNLANGVGDDAYILLDFEMPISGAHLVDACTGMTEFTFGQTLFHELVHAKHIVLGTFNVRDPEHQAKTEENEFRRQQAQAEGRKPKLRCGAGNRQVWFGRDRDPFPVEFSLIFSL